MTREDRVNTYLEKLRHRVSLQDDPNPERALEEFRAELDDLGVPDTPEREEALAEAAHRLKKELSEQQHGNPLHVLIRARRDWYHASDTEGIHFSRYLEYLQNRGWHTEGLKKSTREIVGHLANPAEPETFPCKGLVVGHVQSGKTANMMGVIARAVDAGYNFVIILAGMTDSLRHQTQQRIEDDLVRRNPGNWVLLTQMNEYDDDGNLTASGEYQLLPRGIRPSRSQVLLAVIKKNRAPLERLTRDVAAMTPHQKAGLRALVIDDEADQASPNAGASDEDPTVINRLVRKLLQELDQVSYVGYTATPFANVLINPFPPGITREEETEEKLDDLYPKDFIVALPTPPDYFGAERLFGRYSADPDDPGVDGLDFLRDIEDSEVGRLLPARREDVDTFQPEMTPSLEAAVKWYLLACAARLHRRHGEHHMSMLVHTSMRTVLHERTKEIIKGYIEVIESRVRGSDSTLLQELEELWESEQAVVPEELKPGIAESFRDIAEHLPEVLDRLQIVEMNAIGGERPDYSGLPRCWIVVGGNILARGLTLEGLSTSYFLRTSRQYDTLLQMGRWFGYRKGYEDLQRIWMTPAMQENFRRLALVEQEIRDEIAEYARLGATPLDFAVRIRTFPGLAVTAPARMRHAVTADIDFGGQHLQTIRFRREDRKWLEHNWEAGGRLLRGLHERGLAMEQGRGGLLWRGVPTEDVLRFLDEYQVDESFRNCHEGWIHEYIERNTENYENGWDVAVIQPSRDAGRSGPALGPIEAPALVNRSRLAHADERVADIKALMARRDILVDVPAEGGGDGPGNSWDSIKFWREGKVGSVPLLLLYPIDRESRPRFNASIRKPLDAAHDVLGMGLVFPSMGLGSRARTKRIQVRLEPPVDADCLDELEEENATT